MNVAPHPIQQHVSFPYNKNDLQFPTHIFVKIAPEYMDHLPEDKDGMKIFQDKTFAKIMG